MIDFKLGVSLIITVILGGILFGCLLKLIDYKKFSIFNIVILMGFSIIFPFYLVVNFIKEKDKIVHDNRDLKESSKFIIKECIYLFTYSIVNMPYITDCIVQKLGKF